MKQLEKSKVFYHMLGERLKGSTVPSKEFRKTVIELRTKLGIGCKGTAFMTKIKQRFLELSNGKAICVDGVYAIDNDLVLFPDAKLGAGHSETEKKINGKHVKSLLRTFELINLFVKNNFEPIKFKFIQESLGLKYQFQDSLVKALNEILAENKVNLVWKNTRSADKEADHKLSCSKSDIPGALSRIKALLKGKAEIDITPIMSNFLKPETETFEVSEEEKQELKDWSSEYVARAKEKLAAEQKKKEQEVVYPTKKFVMISTKEPNELGLDNIKNVIPVPNSKMWVIEVDLKSSQFITLQSLVKSGVISSILGENSIADYNKLDKIVTEVRETIDELFD